MRGYQSHTVSQGSFCPCALNLCLIKGLTPVGTRTGAVGTGLAPVRVPTPPVRPVPVSPGHVRHLHPYPPSRRRRR
jgi:hypothetical protein